MEIKIPGSYAFSFCHNIVYIFLFFLYCSIWYPLIWPTDWFLGDKLLILTNTNYSSVLQKRALRLIYFSKTKELTVPLFISSHLLPLHMLYFETVSTLMHGYKTRSSNSGNFFINILKRINNFIDLFSFASLENNTYIHKIIRQGDHYSLANNSRSQVKKNINK